jgi:hypothetical protein
MKTTLCFLGRAHFPFFPDRPTSASSRPTTAQRPIRTGPPPLFPHGTPPATVAPRSVPLPGTFSPPHTTAVGPHPLGTAWPCLIPQLNRPLKSSSRCFERGSLHHRRSLSSFLLPRAPRASLCPSIHASYPGSATGAHRRTRIGAAPLPTPSLR